MGVVLVIWYKDRWTCENCEASALTGAQKRQDYLVIDGVLLHKLRVLVLNLILDVCQLN